LESNAPELTRHDCNRRAVFRQTHVGQSSQCTNNEDLPKKISIELSDAVMIGVITLHIFMQWRFI